MFEDSPLPEQKAKVVHELMRAGDPVLSDDLQELVRRQFKPFEGDWTAKELYAEGKHVLADRVAATRWAQKATSYVFHIQRILQLFPEATLLFLIRNLLEPGGIHSAARALALRRAHALGLGYRGKACSYVPAAVP